MELHCLLLCIICISIAILVVVRVEPGIHRHSCIPIYGKRIRPYKRNSVYRRFSRAAQESNLQPTQQSNQKKHTQHCHDAPITARCTITTTTTATNDNNSNQQIVPKSHQKTFITTIANDDDDGSTTSTTCISTDLSHLHNLRLFFSIPIINHSNDHSNNYSASTHHFLLSDTSPPP